MKKQQIEKYAKLLFSSNGRMLAIGFALLAAVILVWLTVRTVSETSVSLDTDDTIDVTPQQIESIKAIGEWEFLSVADEELVDTVRRGFFSDDHLVRIYYGTVRLGVNMHQVKPGWIDVHGDSITVTLPKMGLLSRDFIDEARTKNFHESGTWKGADREALFQKAQRQMLNHCVTPANLKTARENGEAQFIRMMKTMGFDHVSVVFEE